MGGIVKQFPDHLKAGHGLTLVSGNTPDYTPSSAAGDEAPSSDASETVEDASESTIEPDESPTI